MSAACPIQFRFIKHVPTTPEDDEILSITPFAAPDGSRKFLWRYSYESRKTTNVSVFENEFFLFEKIRSLTILLPTSPSVLFRASDLSDAFENIRDSITAALRHWPVKMDTAAAAEMAIRGQDTLKDSPGSFTRSGCCYTPPLSKKSYPDKPPPLIPLAKTNPPPTKVGKDLYRSDYSYFTDLRPNQEEYGDKWNV